MNNCNNNYNGFMNPFNGNINAMNGMNGFMQRQMNNNIFSNNMNQNFTYNPFPFNFVPNSPQNFSNLGGNMNNFNNIMNNNMNNINIFRSFNSAQISQKMSIDDINEEITINFRFFNANCFKVKAKRSEKLKDIITRFKNSQCPKELKNYLSVCVCLGQKADQNKTLFEIGIKNGEQILFMNNNTTENTQEDKDKNELEYKLTQREKNFLRKKKLEYNKMLMTKELERLKIKNKKNNDNDTNNSDYEGDNEEEIPTFKLYLREKDDIVGTGINVKEHKHKLVYCMTRLKWNCNCCKVKFKKEIGKYYCSLCDYSMCEDCHDKRNYFMRKSFPKNTNPSNSSVNIHFLDTDYHEHRLVYCRSSRHFTFFNNWICDNCRETFHNNKWSFYCTLCDYDLCADCCGYH